MLPGLFAQNVDFHADLIRNIPALPLDQNLFDDLSNHSDDWRLAHRAETSGSTHGSRLVPIPDGDSSAAMENAVIAYPFSAHRWQRSRYSDGKAFGLFYGSLEIETTIHETAWHWYEFIRDSFPDNAQEFMTERAVFDVRCEALLVDLRGKEILHPALVDRSSYEFTHRVGQYVHQQGLNGFLVRSARCDGTNGVVFNPERLSDVREQARLRYRLNLLDNKLIALDTKGAELLGLQPSSLA
jgi:hypothetical protein